MSNSVNPVGFPRELADGVAKPTVSSITILAGQPSGTFTVKTFKVSSDKTVKIKASANGTSKQATLTVKEVTKTNVPLWTHQPSPIKQFRRSDNGR